MTEAPSHLAATPLLDAALEQLRLEGAIFFRSELTEPFAFESTPSALADLLHPGADARDPVPHRRPGNLLGRRRRRRATLGRGRRRDRVALRRPPRDRRTGAGRVRCDHCVAGVAAAVGRHPGDPPRRGRRPPSTSCAATSCPRTRCSIPRCACSRPRSSSASRRVRRRAGCRPASRTRSRRTCRRTRVQASCSTRLPELVLIEVLRLPPRIGTRRRSRMARGAARPGARAGAWRSCTRRPGGVGRWRSSRRAPRSRARCSTNGSARYSAGRRSATSRSGACTWPRSCSTPPTSAWCRSRDASGTNRRKRSAAPSSAPTDNHRATGGWRGLKSRPGGCKHERTAGRQGGDRHRRGRWHRARARAAVRRRGCVGTRERPRDPYRRRRRGRGGRDRGGRRHRGGRHRHRRPGTAPARSSSTRSTRSVASTSS